MAPLIAREDLAFLLYDWLRLDELLARPRFADHSRETVDALLDLSERVATEHFLTHYRQSDLVEPRLDAEGVHILPAASEALRRYGELGFAASTFAPEQGGSGYPFLVGMASFAQFAAANIATASYAMLTSANARLIAAFGNEAQIATFAAPEIEGRWFGTMAMSEPQAGSSLADVRTKAVPDGRDAWGARYRLTGNKMWISGGDQDASENIVHLVLAKVPDSDGRLPEGTRGLSLFIVPKRLPDGAANDIAIAGLNHKMGYRGTSNCLLHFGEKGGAIGWLIGAEGDGIRQMFAMMNEARIAVGLGAAALGYRGYAQAVNYARERVQGRPPGARDTAPVSIIAHPDVKRMLLTAKAYAEGALALVFYCARLVDEDDTDARALLALLTPVAKTWPSEYALAANDIAIQIHGGYGYTRDFDVEQLYRDNRLNAIHEGTTGIQGIDLVGRKLLRDDGTALAVLAQRIETTLAKANHTVALISLGAQLADAWADVRDTIESLRETAPDRAFDHATIFLRAFGHVIVAWLMLDRALVAARSADANPHHAGKLCAARWFFESELPLVKPWLEMVRSRSDVASAADAAIF